MQGVEAQYIELLREANSGCTTDIALLSSPIRIPVEKGVKQGDTISPKLFTTCLEQIFRDIDWKGGVNINGELLTHLRFADDIVLVAETTDLLQTMLTELDIRSSRVGLKMNRMKTKFMRSDYATRGRIVVQGDEIEEVEEYVYLGQEVNMRRDMEKEISRRIRAGWKAFNSIKDVLKGKLDKTTRANLFNGTVLPAMLYGSETWATTKREEQRLVSAQRAMERSMLGISLREHIRSETIREKSGVRDVINEYEKQKLRWAGHVARFTDNRWTRAIVEWYPRERKRPLGRPPKRWIDDIRKTFGATWMRKARSREEWEACCDQRSRFDAR
uniref:ribonuclease H n=1 Tax=Scleropages formosus TaxID=113540 RepID=A0A8C9S512_SCLFO